MLRLFAISAALAVAWAGLCVAEEAAVPAAPAAAPAVDPFETQPAGPAPVPARSVMIQLVIGSVSWQAGSPAEPPAAESKDTDAGGRKAPPLAQRLAEALNAAPEAHKPDPADEIRKLLGKPEGLVTLSEPVLVTLDGRAATLQLGQRVPRVTGVSSTPRGRMSSVNFESVGQLIEVTPQINPDGTILVQLQLETSQLAPEGPDSAVLSSEEGNETRLAGTDTLTLHTAALLCDGRAAVVMDQVSARGAQCREFFVLLTARVVK